MVAVHAACEAPTAGPIALNPLFEVEASVFDISRDVLAQVSSEYR
jgi:hypothetical protein